jgi:hypothetical protein
VSRACLYDRALPAFLATVLVVGATGRLSAGEITVFVSADTPRTDWNHGQGAVLTMGLFKVLLLEVEGARSLSDAGSTHMTYFTFSAALKLPKTRITPFGGMGVGVYYQSETAGWRLNTLDSVFVGAKTRIEDLIVLRVEYRRFVLRGDPFLPFRDRFSVGAGVAF